MPERIFKRRQTPVQQAEHLLHNVRLSELDLLWPTMENQEWEKVASALGGIALRAGQLASYLDARYMGQGHRVAVRKCNATAKKIWVGCFGYLNYHKINF